MGLFGSSQDKIWKQLASELQGQFIGNTFMMRNAKVIAKSDQWAVTLDTYVGMGKVIYTRMRAPYRNIDNFHFTIYQAGLLSPLARMFGMQDITIGDPEFDDAFVIKGTDEEKTRRFFNDPQLKAKLLAQPQIYLETKDDEGNFIDFPSDLDELAFHQEGVICDLSALRSMYELFAYTLHRLSEFGVASEDAPHFPR